MAKKVSKAIVKKTKKTIRRLAPDENRAVGFVVQELGVSKEEARAMLFQEEGMKRYLKYKRTELDLEAIKLLHTLQAAAKKKAEHGSLEQAKAATTAVAIIRDKIWGRPPDQRPTMMFGAEEMKINVQFPFRPYKKDKEIGQVQEAEILNGKEKVSNVKRRKNTKKG